jgi:hypothetical protein
MHRNSIEATRATSRGGWIARWLADQPLEHQRVADGKARIRFLEYD